MAADSWGMRWTRWRNGVVANARFQRFAAAFPLTRAIARRRAARTFDVVAGFVYSQVLQACVQLDLLELLGRNELTCDAVARRVDLSPDAARRLLDAAVAIELLDRSADRYRLGTLGAQIHGNPGIVAMVRHHALFYADLADPVGLLRGHAPSLRLASYWPYASAAEPAALAAEHVAAYTRLMSASQSFIAHEVLSVLPLDGYRSWLDVGGGDGTFLATLGERAPHLKLMLFDLPPVAAMARTRLAAAGIGDRVHVVGGDFLRDALPMGADVVSFVRVLHDHDDARVLTMLRAARAALPDDGSLVIAEPLAAVPGAARMSDAYFGLYLLAMGRGSARTPAQFAALLAQAGFGAPRLIPTHIPLQTSVLIAPTDRR